MKDTEHIHWEAELPEGYEEVLSVDAKSKKFTIFMTVGSLILTVIPIVIAYFLIRPTDFYENFNPVSYFVALGALLVYIVLHELTHGAAYKLLTGRKLTFGMTLTVAYCGVPDIFVYRKAALISLLAPFTVFSVVFLAAAFLLPNPWDQFYAAVVFAIHFGGCIGDLYDTVLYLTRFRDPKTLMKDTGPKQTFYLQK